MHVIPSAKMSSRAQRGILKESKMFNKKVKKIAIIVVWLLVAAMVISTVAYIGFV